MEDENGRIYIFWLNSRMLSAVLSATRDSKNRNGEKTVFLFCNRIQMIGAIEDVFRLSNAARVICLHNTPPFRCHSEFFRDRKTYKNYRQRERRRVGVDPEETFEQAQQTLFHAYMIRHGKTAAEMESFMFNFGEFLENLIKPYVKDEKEAD